jgi:hypothetical protein
VKKQTHWHQILSLVLEKLLIPVGISVEPDIKVMQEPPEADILLLRRENQSEQSQTDWTAEQFELLPDGIRDSKASHILLEFKYTESINEDAFAQIVCYQNFYKKHKKLPAKEVSAFLLSSKQPRKKTLVEFGYQESKIAGIYFSKFPLLKNVTLISLNELADTENNIFLKFFASQKKEQIKVYNIFSSSENLLNKISQDLYKNMTALWQNLFNFSGDNEMRELTRKDIESMSKNWGHIYFKTLTVNQRLDGLTPEEQLTGLKPEDIFKKFRPEEIEACLEKIKSKS